MSLTISGGFFLENLGKKYEKTAVFPSAQAAIARSGSNRLDMYISSTILTESVMNPIAASRSGALEYIFQSEKNSNPFITLLKKTCNFYCKNPSSLTPVMYRKIYGDRNVCRTFFFFTELYHFNDTVSYC